MLHYLNARSSTAITPATASADSVEASEQMILSGFLLPLNLLQANSGFRPQHAVNTYLDCRDS